jgi:hypothetical protein
MDNWQSHKQFSLELWEQWITNSLRFNLGMLCGAPSGLTLIDIDNQEGEEYYGGLDRAGRTEASWIFTTGKGRRILFRDREGCQSFKIPTGSGQYIEVLSNGRQSVIPPSVHVTGRRYAWVDGFTPLDLDAGILPAIFEGAKSSDPGGAITSERTDWQAELERTESEGNRNEFLTRLIGHLISPEPLPIAEVRMWAKLWNNANCSPPLPDREIETIIKSVDKREQASKVRDIMVEYNVGPKEAQLMLENMISNEEEI